MELPEDYLDLLIHYARAHPRPSQYYTHIVALSAAGWSTRYLNSHVGHLSATRILVNYRGQEMSDFELPIVPQPSIHSPHIIKLRSLFTTPEKKNLYHSDLPLTGLTQEQSESLRKQFLEFRKTKFYIPRDDPHSSPKYKALAPLAKDLVFYYSLGVSPSDLAIALTDGAQSVNTVPYRIMKAYFQWHTPSMQLKRQSTFSLIYSPQISNITKHLLNRLSPTPENLESLSQTPHCTRFGKDLTVQTHLFRRESYRTLFPELPETVTLFGQNKEKLSLSDVQPLVDAVHV